MGIKLERFFPHPRETGLQTKKEESAKLHTKFEGMLTGNVPPSGVIFGGSPVDNLDPTQQMQKYDEQFVSQNTIPGKLL